MWYLIHFSGDHPATGVDETTLPLWLRRLRVRDVARVTEMDGGRELSPDELRKIRRAA